MSNDEKIINQLKEMGFDELKIKRALKETKGESIEQVMEWIIAHESEVVSSPAAEGNHSVSETEPNSEDHPTETENVSKSKSPEELELEKKRYEELIKQRRLEREEKEKNEAIEKEKNRRKTGCEVSKLREKMENEERIRMAQEIRRDKLESEAHKKAVLEQIKRDREAMKNRSSSGSNDRPQPVPVVSPVSSTTTSNRDHTSCKLAIRLPNGQTLQEQFSANEQLSSVRLYIQMNRKDKPNTQDALFDLIFPPNKRFTDEEMEKTLLDLGLCPTARLTVSDRKP